MSIPFKQTKNLVHPEQWSNNYQELLIRIAFKKVSDYQIAEDLVQDTFLSAWKGLHNFRGDCSEKTFLCGILNNKIIDFYRVKARRPTIIASQMHSDDQADNAPDFFSQQADTSENIDPALIANRTDFLIALESAMEKLPVKMRRLVRMRMLEDQSTVDITTQLNITESSLWVSIHRAKKILKTELKGNWDADSLAA